MISGSRFDVQHKDHDFLADAFGLVRPEVGGSDTHSPSFNTERVLSTLDHAPCLIAVTRGSGHIVEFANRACRHVLGDVSILGRPLQAGHGVLAGPDFLRRLDDAFSQTEHLPGPALEAERRMGDLTVPLFLDFVIEPVLSASGGVTGLLIEGHDVTERVLFRRRQALFMDEMNHRMKNTLATVLALIRLARQSATTVDAFTDALSQRIVAMGKTQGLIVTTALDSVCVQDILALELAPYLGEGGPVELSCGDLEVASLSAVNLSLIVHELLTNAAKHGALSELGGRLQVVCANHPDGGAILTWRETTASPLRPVGPAGFGSSLIARLARGLGGGLDLTWRADGLDALIRFAALPGTHAAGV